MVSEKTRIGINGIGRKAHIRFRIAEYFIVLADPDPQGSKPVEASDQSMKR